jgi:alpha-L-rhamnosidase
LAGADHLWDEGFQLGDWLDPNAAVDDPADARTDRYLVATAYFAWSARHVAMMADVLGYPELTAHYHALALQAGAAFRGAYVVGEGRLSSDTQTAYALAVRFGLLSAGQAEAAGARLAQLVADAEGRIATGFAGTPVISDALSMVGETERAYQLLLQRRCPSWLYAVGCGATTVWERWDALLPDGSVNPGRMTSFNHYALGSIADWMHRVVAGLAPAAPGYRKILFRPRPGGGITSASAQHESPYGRVGIAWQARNDEITVELHIPIGSAGSLDVEGSDLLPLGPGSHSVTRPLLPRGTVTPGV